MNSCEKLSTLNDSVTETPLAAVTLHNCFLYDFISLAYML